MQELQISCFENIQLPSQQTIDNLDIPYSMISYTDSSWNKPYNLLKQCSKDIYKVYTDGFTPIEQIDEHAYLFKFVFSTNCSSITPDMIIVTYENLFDIKDDFYQAIIKKNPLEVKISLLNQGVRLSSQARQYVEQTGKIRNAVFSAVDITIFVSAKYSNVRAKICKSSFARC
jgi:hypothetical protein